MERRKLALTSLDSSVYYIFMNQPLYQELQDLAQQRAQALPRPSFYREHAAQVNRAEASLASHEFILRCRDYLNESLLECAHGLCHCEAVARDAGTIVLIEAEQANMDPSGQERLFTASIIAGLLHDIKRKEQDHAVRGSIEAERILSKLGMELCERQYIADAIRNHEAFQEAFDRNDAAGQLVSDALYDADKFRWGPENFTTTLWLMVDAHNTPPEALHRTFKEKMKGIEKIKETFRTPTGKRFGPEFIDQGISIGNAIYDKMSEMLERSR